MNNYDKFLNDLIRKINDPVVSNSIAKSYNSLQLKTLLEIINKSNINLYLVDKTDDTKIYYKLDETCDVISFMNELAIIRKRKNISMSKLENLLNKSRQTINRYENDRLPIRMCLVLDYLDILNTTIKIVDGDISPDDSKYIKIENRPLITKYRFLHIQNSVLDNYELLNEYDDMKILYLYKDSNKEITDICNIIISINNIDISYDLIESGFTHIIFHESGEIAIENPNNLYERFSKRGGIKFRLNNNDKVLITTDDTDLIIKITQD